MTTAAYCTNVTRIVEAIRRQIREHGAPNSFTPRELHEIAWCRVRPATIGRYAAGVCWELNRRRGWRVTYTDRRFRVEAAPANP